MTQIVCAITQEYVLLASDRELTHASGPLKGQHLKDSCKLVNLCGTTGIAYAGIGEMKGGVPTHEWIGKTLAEAGCCDAPCAEKTLANRAPDAVSSTPNEDRRHTFLMAGWAYFGDPPLLRPYWAEVTNARDATGKRTSGPLEFFNSFRRYLRGLEDLDLHVIGENIVNSRAENLGKNLRKLVRREIGPKEALRLLIEEIIYTSGYCNAVGSKILGFCIPKKGAQAFFEKGKFVMLATQPNTDTTAFVYFEAGYSELSNTDQPASAENSQ